MFIENINGHTVRPVSSPPAPVDPPTSGPPAPLPDNPTEQAPYATRGLLDPELVASHFRRKFAPDPAGESAAAAPAAAPALDPGQGGAEDDTVRVVVNTFIPQEQLDDPFGRTFDGDGRDVGEPGTYRTQQEIVITEAPGGEPRVSVIPRTGDTENLDTGETANAGTAGLQATTERRDDGTIVVRLRGNVGNPLAQVEAGPVEISPPAITYEMTIELQKNADGQWVVKADGQHDGFPGYEVLASVNGAAREVVYGYDPRDYGRGPVALFPHELNVHADNAALIVDPAQRPAAPPRAEELIRRNTSGGRVDTEALGAELAYFARAFPARAPGLIDGVMGGLGDEDAFQAGVGFLEAATDAQLRRMAGTPEGTAALLRLEEAEGRDYRPAEDQYYRIYRVLGDSLSALAATDPGEAARRARQIGRELNPLTRAFVAERFVDSLSNEQLTAVARRDGGRATLEEMKRWLEEKPVKTAETGMRIYRIEQAL